MTKSDPKHTTEVEQLPLLPLRNSVLFPASVVPVNVGRARSVRLIEQSFGQDNPTIGVVSQKNAEIEDPTLDQIYSTGTVARVLKVIRLSSGNYSVVLQGIARMHVTEMLTHEPFMQAVVSRIHEPPATGVEIDALATQLRERARDLLQLLPHLPRETASILDNVTNPGALADLVTSNLPIGTEAKQVVLELLDVRDRLRKVSELVTRQSRVHEVKKEISTMVREEMSRSQREFLLRQQMHSIRLELGEEDEDDEIELLRERIARADMPSEAEKASLRQLRRMRTMNPAGSEYHVALNYVDWMADLPWRKHSPIRLDVGEARRVLDEDHHGLENVKKRILEFMAVQKLRADVRGPILCFVGPPGVGKTSLTRSIARATGRNFVRVALGGVQDEAEIRGHRRTYVGAYPGKLIAGYKRAAARNPVMLLDEIDKMGGDFGGNPASALLEVLDPEQNFAFADHYIEVPFDLSSTIFIATANRIDKIPRPLLDRMELVELPGYTRDEKRAIAKQFLIPRQLSEHGLSPERLDFSDEGIEHLVEHYTHEAGVRNLERQVAAVCRSVAVRLAEGEDVMEMAGADYVERILGPARQTQPVAQKVSRPGISTGVAWTPAGGALLFVEASQMPGKGQLYLTGNMGDIMKESVYAAFTYIRARATDLGLDPDFLSKIDIHVHLPQGAIPKDGPAAGITIFVALASQLTRLKVRHDVAMSGEMTLRGNILEVSGIKEKCLAAHRAGLKHLILPTRNEPDLEEVPEQVLAELSIHLVSRLDQVLPLVLDLPPEAPTAPHLG